MAGASFSMDMAALTKLVEGMRDAMSNRQTLMEAIGDAMVTSTVGRFEKGVGPDGKAWAETQRGGQILVDSARLKSSQGYEASPDKVIWGSNLVYSAIHQFGGETGRNHSVTLPARASLGMDEDDKEEVQHMMHLHLKRGR